MPQMVIFDTKAEMEAYKAAALEAYNAAHTSNGSLMRATKWCQGAQREDGKYTACVCDHMNNEGYTVEEMAESWYPINFDI